METLFNLFYAFNTESDIHKQSMISSKIHKIGINAKLTVGEDSDLFVSSVAQLLSLESLNPELYNDQSCLEPVKNTASALLYGYIKNLITHKLIDRHKMYLYLKILLEIPFKSKVSYAISCQLSKSIEKLCTTPDGCVDSIASTSSSL